MDEDNSSRVGLASPLRPLLTYGIPILGAGVWAYAKFADRLRWTDEVFARAFGLAAAFYEDLTHVEGYGEALDAAIDALEVPPIRVLDLGCGTGYAARRIQQAFPDADVVGVDLSPEMVLMARREADEEGLDIVFEVGDASELDYEDETFDLVVSLNVPPHTKETMRVLAPSGTALTVWSFGGPWVGLAWPALAKQLRKAGALHAEGHRAGLGFYGVAEKSGIRRRRRPRTAADGGGGRSRARRVGVGAPAARREGAAFQPPPPPPPPAKPKATTRPAAGATARRSAAAQAAAAKAGSGKPTEPSNGPAARAKTAAARRPAPKPSKSAGKSTTRTPRTAKPSTPRERRSGGTGS
jgi:SAM-dependent methyltransferase